MGDSPDPGAIRLPLALPSMRILYVDIDTLRADHLGCYGYHRQTSPTIDALAADGVRFDRCYASDTPCLPSRSALITGRFGIHNGAIDHGGAAAEPFSEGADRRFQSRLATTSFARRLRNAGIRSTTISTFGERHSAHHWYAGFNEVHNIGLMGIERADEVAPVALDWITRNGAADDWFLHVHLWDPHTPYRTPPEYGDPFAGEPTPAWLTEDVRRAHWERPGPHSAQEAIGYSNIHPYGRFPRQPLAIDSMDAVRAMFDGYDTGVRWADDHLGRIIDALDQQGVLDETAVMVSSDHGETLGELGIYCDHHTADQVTARLPMVLRWPDGLGGRGRVDHGLRYQIDVVATVLELAGGKVPGNWDGQSFAAAFSAETDSGRDFLVTSQAAWCTQRSVRWDDWLLMKTYESAWHGFADHMLFDVVADPHEQHDLAEERPDVVSDGLRRLEAWRADAMAISGQQVDPLETVLAAGGGFHARTRPESYFDRLRETGRGEWADRFEVSAPPPAIDSRRLSVTDRDEIGSST